MRRSREGCREVNNLPTGTMIIRMKAEKQTQVLFTW